MLICINPTCIKIVAFYNFYTMDGQVYIGFCLVQVLHRTPAFQHLLYKDAKTQKQILVLVPKIWLPRASGLSKLSLFTFLLIWEDRYT